MTTATFTEKQRRAIEAMEDARNEGVALGKYAKAHGLIIRELYEAIACLRRKGLLVKPTRKAGCKFVAVRVMAPSEPTQASPSKSTSEVVCRIREPARPGDRVHAMAAIGVTSIAHGGACGCCDLTAGSSGCTCIERP